MKIAVLDDYSDIVPTLSSFGDVAGHDVTIWNDHEGDLDRLADRLKDTEVLVPFRERTLITGDLLDRLPNLRLISQSGAFPHIDLEGCRRNGVTLSAVAGAAMGPSYATSELTWGLIIAASREIPQEMAALTAGRWQQGAGRTLRGRTLGIFGYGRLGGVLAEYATAFGMSVLVWGSGAGRERAAADGYPVATDQRSFFATADVVTLHLRLVDENRGIVTADDLAAMKPDALLVNTSRAGLIEPGALAAALKAGRPGGAALDVFDTEPILGGGVADEPLLSMSNVVATPHIGFVTREGLERQFAGVFAQIAAFEAGEPINVVV